jgi:hypothetical protein
MPAKLRVVGSTPNTENRKVAERLANAEYRTREYLTPDEVEILLRYARKLI